jgi:hypothetical protein
MDLDIGRKIIVSHIGVCVTNNNGFWIFWLGLLALLYNYSQFWQPTITDCPRLAPFLTGPRASSLLLSRMPNEAFQLTHWTALNDTCLTNFCEESLATEIFWTKLTSMQTEYRSPLRTVNCPSFRCHENLFLATCYLTMTSSLLFVAAGTWLPSRY